MSNSEETTVETPSTPPEGKAEYGYPVRNFDSMIGFVTTIYNDLGHGVYHTKEQIAAAHNLSVNTIKQHLSSAQMFELLEIKHGTGYKTTDLFAKIYLPENEEARRETILESIRSVVL